MFIQVFGIVFPIFAIIGVGFFYAKRYQIDMRTANQINLDVFIPALIFSVLSAKDFQITDYLNLALAGVFVVLGSGVIAWVIARSLDLDIRTFVPPMMFNNSGNMGLPLVLFAFGKAAVPAAVMLFLVENLSHFTIGVWILDHKPKFFSIMRIPMVWSSFAGIAFSVFGFSLWEPLSLSIELLGQISIPLLLFALGVRLISIDLKDWKIGLLGAVVRPLSGLVIAWSILAFFPLHLDDAQKVQLILFSALPPAVLNYMMAERYQQQPTVVASIVMLGNLLSVVVMPTVLYFVL